MKAAFFEKFFLKTLVKKTESGYSLTEINERKRDMI